MKKSPLDWLSAVATAAGDFLLVLGVFMLGFWLRHSVLAGPLFDLFGLPFDFRLSAGHYLISGSMMGAVTVLVLQAFGAYRRNWGLAHIEEIAWILRSTFMAVVITLAVSLAVRQTFFSRFVLLFAFPAASAALSVWHALSSRLYRSICLRAGRARRTVVYGAGRLAAELARHLERSAAVPARIVAFVAPPGSSEEKVVEALEPAGVGQALDGLDAELLVIADTTIPREHVAGLIYACEHRDLPYMLVPDIFTLVSLTTRITSLGGTTMIESVPPPLGGARRLLKRALDLALTSLLLPLLAIPCLAVSAAILLDDGPPVLFRQTRLGRDNRPFGMYKFRSMRVGADREKASLRERNEASGPLFKIRDDPRVTRTGRFLRRFSLDELPQLINVLEGSMSLIGPRPPLPEEVREYSEKQLNRLRTTPGMTGVWQVSGRSQLGFEEMVKLDLYYVDNWSVWLDLAILMLTIPAALSRRGAY